MRSWRCTWASWRCCMRALPCLCMFPTSILMTPAAYQLARPLQPSLHGISCTCANSAQACGSPSAPCLVRDGER
jgi:hypothetical protein